jgi:hypothetical protein
VLNVCRRALRTPAATSSVRGGVSGGVVISQSAGHDEMQDRLDIFVAAFERQALHDSRAVAQHQYPDHFIDERLRGVQAREIDLDSLVSIQQRFEFPPHLLPDESGAEKMVRGIFGTLQMRVHVLPSSKIEITI